MSYIVEVKGKIGEHPTSQEAERFDRLLEKVIDKPENIKKNSKRRNRRLTNKFFFFKYILLFIGLGATYMSIYYSFLWFYNFLNIFYSFLLSTIMVSFAVCAFELIIIFKRMRKYIVSVVFSFLWIIVTLFSMVSTVAGQYNARIPEIKKRYQIDNSKNKIQLNIKAKENLKAGYEKIIENLYKQLEMNDKLLSNFQVKEDDPQSKKRYDSIVWRSNKVRRKINWYSKKIEGVYKSLGKISSNGLQVDNFYVWASNFLKLSPDWIQFVLSIFPALFIDLIAPFSFAVIIFIFNKR